MTISEMKEKKREYGWTNQMVASLSGVPLSTVQKIFGGATSAPRKETVDALSAIFRSANMSGSPAMIREPAPAYGVREAEKKEYTLKDYYALPDERRVELIDGVFYDMASPSKLHQSILGSLYLQLDACVEKHEGACFLYLAPSDVELGEDGKTVVQPDLYIHCSPEKESNRPHHGAPDFVLEILSPSSRGHDIWRKQELYRRYGVKEYWIVDPEQKRVLVYLFDREEFPKIYSFADRVPLALSGGSCSVDFQKVYDRARHLYEN